MNTNREELKMHILRLCIPPIVKI